MRRILLVTNVFPPAIGGPATFMDALASELTRRGFGVIVLRSAAGGEADAGRLAVLALRKLRSTLSNGR